MFFSNAERGITKMGNLKQQFDTSKISSDFMETYKDPEILFKEC